LLGAQATTYGGRSFIVRASATKTDEHQRRIATIEGNARELGLGTTEVLSLARAKALHPGDAPFHHEETPEYAKDAVEWWAERQRAVRAGLACVRRVSHAGRVERPGL